MFIFPRRQQCYHLFGCETHANRAITAQSLDYLVYLRNLAGHKDLKCLHDDISGPCVSQLILAPELGWTVNA